jgi:hypothetical protein
MIWAGNIYNSSIGSNTTEMPDEKMDYASDRILQITPLAVRLISGDGTFKTSWTAPLQLTIASVNPHSGQIIVTSGTDLYYLRIDLDEIHLVKQISFENEVACMDISPLGK